MVVVNNVGTREEDLTHKKYRIWYLRDRSQRSLACKLQSDWQGRGSGRPRFPAGKQLFARWSKFSERSPRACR
jgi:hypothetical protein